MKINLISGIVVVAGLLAASVAVAQQPRGPYDVRPNERYCRDASVRSGSAMVCQHYTMQQCLDSRSSPGESCYLNPILAFRGNR